MAALTVDLTAFPLEVRERLRSQLADEESAKLALALTRQKKISELYNSNVGPGTTKDGFGPLSMVVDPFLVSYFRRRFGDRCFSDPEFEEWLKKEDPTFRVRETGTRLQFGYTAPSARKCRFHKTYA